MNCFLDFFGYEEPVIKNYYDPVNKFRVIINENESEAVVLSKGEQWLLHNFIVQGCVWEVFSHYWIAKGHCICTGLGMAIRESWILNKKEVSKVTVLERDEGVIEYHRINNPKLFKELEIVKADAYQYKGKCDTLLLDHYEGEDHDFILNSSSKILDNIECNVMWLWPLEQIIGERYSLDNLSSVYEGYNKIKHDYSLHKLPNISEQLLGLFMIAYSNGLEIEFNQIERKQIKSNSRSSWEKTNLPGAVSRYKKNHDKY